MALPPKVAFIQTMLLRLVLPRDGAGWSPKVGLAGPWGFAFRSSTGFARVEVVNFSPICTPTYGVARCLRVRNRCLELGGSGVGSRTSTSSSQLLARCGPLRRFHHSGESLLARVPARTWLEAPSPAAVGSIASAGYRTQLLHPFVLQNPNHLDIVTAGLERHGLRGKRVSRHLELALSLSA